MSREFTKVGVIGLGTMGVGIVEVFARNGIDVVAMEVDDAAVERGKGVLAKSTGRALDRGKITQEDHDALHARVTYTTDMGDFADCQLVVEAVPEQLHLKKELFGRLDTIVAPDAILATNTSSLPVTEIAVATSNPKRVVGMHFFNPAPVLQFVEVIRTVITADDVFEDVKALAERLGKKPVIVGDKAGFIANALLFGYLNHAVAMYESKYATREDIDASMRFGCGYPMGPLALLDLIGLDTAYEILDTMYKQGRDRLHAPSPIIKQMVSAGLKGRKNGRGFYTYAAAGSPEVVADAQTPAEGTRAGVEVRTIESVGVIGSGTMATGIVEVFAKAGYAVTFVARGQDKVDGVLSAIAKSQAKMIERGRLTQEEADAINGRIMGATERTVLGDVDIVVEAIAEDLAIKQELFRDLDQICKPGAILATTTSSLPIIDCAKVTSRPGDVIGMHFFNPAQVMKLVEVVHTVATEPDVVATVQNLCASVGKVAVTCGDRSGFIVNALLFPYLNDAIKMLEANYASADDIDTAMKTGCGLPMGPFELLDVVGLDVSLAIQKELYLEFREPGYAPAPLLEHLVTAGYLGRKTGRGFRTY
ncbi:MAG TPA: 3-hydroxybutyryl-CoA dehydrogenase [Phycicoccus elongatus]|jgi:3-hydroxybutyryl-CoA dehydrogenase|uniref:3-hydroxyacyl-CoA dehydrogenase family protein n=1 Tax=Phycicoccus TaxID=367298 RepID=UPI002582920D|nr:MULTISPECIES: 3-hydroxybutyryl-CoA dehydrogenase [Phycicoccus]MCB9407421.1 3-hydroxyacyl-CoA dehydrogenase family protein [Tetrasphaera sp.]MCO5303867.1 3-hydroxybutyryl-CoA dehydrogenase [Phycicoccus sp.]HPK12361.1 3-hydroxybutyryl-CoA dehydrogenase [Phycicoccus elongatus]HPQ74166.1 3-hydroxybutyryl-CoA dehydrogenase [Phycicoccus elongatus]HRV56969.1 3-hydroxybutyryl-CoA dehydrogenase [Phycicoccus sp.]